MLTRSDHLSPVSLLSLESLKTPQEKHKGSTTGGISLPIANAALRKPFETREANQVYPINSKPDDRSMRMAQASVKRQKEKSTRSAQANFDPLVNTQEATLASVASIAGPSGLNLGGLLKQHPALFSRLRTRPVTTLQSYEKRSRSYSSGSCGTSRLTRGRCSTNLTHSPWLAKVVGKSNILHPSSLHCSTLLAGPQRR